MSDYVVSARKYRPDSFESLIGQDNIARTLKNSIQRGQLAHAYLFCGPRGVGKTSALIALLGSLAAIAYLREHPEVAEAIAQEVRETPFDPAKAKAARKAA